MPVGILIPANINEPLTVVHFDRVDEFQRDVGGYIETLMLPTPAETAAILVVNKEGKLSGFDLDVNNRATLLLWVHNRAFVKHDEICGDAIVIGPTDEFGNFTGVPEKLLKLLTTNDPVQLDLGVSLLEPQTAVRGTFRTWVGAYIVVADALGSIANLEHVRIDVK